MVNMAIFLVTTRTYFIQATIFDFICCCCFLFFWVCFNLYSWHAGGMTEEKKRVKRVALAKWLKENILRLGPTFIKIGQQFSTRVDILAQEYVDQLSELQVNILVATSEFLMTYIILIANQFGFLHQKN